MSCFIAYQIVKLVSLFNSYLLVFWSSWFLSLHRWGAWMASRRQSQEQCCRVLSDISRRYSMFPTCLVFTHAWAPSTAVCQKCTTFWRRSRIIWILVRIWQFLGDLFLSVCEWYSVGEVCTWEHFCSLYWEHFVMINVLLCFQFLLVSCCTSLWRVQFRVILDTI